MRRAEREIKDKEIIFTILQEAVVCRIGLSVDNMPYIVPMNFGFDSENIYLHSAKEGKKIDIIKKNPHVCFEVENKIEIIKAEKACSWGMRYESVIGYGEAEIITDAEEKIRALDLIMKKYSKDIKYDYSVENQNKVEVIKIKVNNMTGKKSRY